MRWILYITVLWFTYLHPVCAQKCALLEELEIQLQSGQKRALRDVGILLDDSLRKPLALQLLENYTFFTPSTLTIDSNLTKSQFVNFYYDHFEKIRFSPLLSSFYITPVEARESDFYYKKKLESNIQSIQYWWNLLRSTKPHDKKFEALLNQLILATKIHPEPQLFQPLKKEISHIFQTEDRLPDLLYGLYAEWATWFEDEQDIRLLLHWLETDKLAPKEAHVYFARLTNHVFPEHADEKTPLIEAYHQLLDTFGSVERMLKAGYDAFIGFSPTHFPNRYYFLGKVISTRDCPPWIFQNAVKELKASRDPIQLFFFAGKYFQERNSQANEILTRKDWFDLVKNLSRVNLYRDSACTRSVGHSDILPLRELKQYLLFWAGHYQQFTWSEAQSGFVHQGLLSKEKEQYEKYFPLLTKSNDSISREAYYQLIKAPVTLLQEMLPEQQNLNPRLHRSLPPWRYGLLSIANQLYHLDPEGWKAFNEDEDLQILLSQLQRETNPSRRFRLEEALIQKITPVQLTGFEIWALVHSNQDQTNLSAYRIIRTIYHQNLCYFWKNEAKANLFFLKAKALDPYQDYLALIPLDDNCTREFIALNDALIAPEVRQDFLRYKVGWQIQFDPNKVFKATDLISAVEISSLPPLALKYQETFFTSLFQIPPANRDPLKVYFSSHLKEEHLPVLFKYLKAKKETAWILICIENFFQYEESGSIRKKRRRWLKRWQEANEQCSILGEMVWQEQLSLIKDLAPIPESTIEWLVNSPYYQASEKDVLLKAIKKNGNVRLFHRLSFQPPLKAADLGYFGDFQFDLYALDDLPRLFESSAVPALYNFMMQQLSGYGPEEKVVFFSGQLIKNQFYTNLPPSSRKQLKSLFEDYLASVSFITEAEEQKLNWLIFSLENGHLSSLEQLELIRNTAVSPQVQFALQTEIFARIAWEEIPAVLEKYGSHFERKIFTPSNFLERDFGLPTGDLSNIEIRKEIATRIRALPKKEVYSLAFRAFGFPLEDEDGNARLSEIYKKLVLAPDFAFAGKGGIIRDYYYFGMMAYLALHFEENFNFPVKLNANQTRKRFSILPRCKKWIPFLEKKLSGH